MSDLILREIYGIYETKIQQIEIFERYVNLSEDTLSEKSNKNVYVKNDVMTTGIKRWRGKEKRGRRKIDGFRKKLMIQDYEIAECPEHKVKWKIGKIFVNGKILEEYSLKIYEIDPYFYEHYKKKKKLTKMSMNTYYLELMFILLNII